MNRLILLGNGFDLAHGLPTRYNDFILWYLKKVFRTANHNNGYKDGLINITIAAHFDQVFQSHSITIEDFVDHFFNKSFDELLNESHLTSLRHSLRFRNPYSVTMVPFLQTLVMQCQSMNWVDIENQYYDVLKVILKEGANQNKSLSELNSAMECLVEEMRQYFRDLEISGISEEMLSLFKSTISFRELRSANKQAPPVQTPKLTHILSFNYTETASLYFNSLDSDLFELNYIHGQAEDEKTPLIFGFGDELDEKYPELEVSKINDYFTFIKSFGYLKTRNYYSLLRFLAADDFQVVILGHSCGLSDRTMLNMLFKHKNCESIKIYYYVDPQGKANFTELTQEISRHFKDKEMLRERVVNFEFCKPMPQVSL